MTLCFGDIENLNDLYDLMFWRYDPVLEVIP